MDLFSTTSSLTDISQPPLAARMAPREWDEFIGQEHLVAPGSLLRRAIEADRLGSSIFFGPPGTGKTALARLAARKSNAAIEYINAVTAGVADLRAVVKRALDRKNVNGQRTLLIVDEIHHFNKSQQDALLPDVERGLLTLVGLTTENPYFYVNAALMSRSTAFEFKSLTDDALVRILGRAVENKQHGLGDKKIQLSKQAERHFLLAAEGDARRILNAVELAVSTTAPNADGVVVIDEEVARSSTQRRAVRYDKSGDEHYDTISAFIKSMRGSDPDAALYWMAKMLSAGEDPRFVARRIMIFAAEDVGNADPQAISVAIAASRMVEMVGMPEARIPLAQAVTYVATAPKSNASYMAYEKAAAEVREGKKREVPNHLKDASRDSKALGHGQGYKYPHDFPRHHVEQEYMPERMSFYEPSDQGFDAVIAQRLKEWRKKNPSR
jgi:putative ATPase